MTIDWAYGERVIDHTRHHWCVPLLGMARMSVEVLGVGAMSIGMALLPFSVGWLQLTMALCAVAHQCWMARHLLRWRSDLIIATNWRLIRTGGILSSGVQSYRWDTINNISRNAKPLARLFRCWNIRVVQGGGWHNEGASLEYVIRVPRRMAILIEQLGSRPAGELRDQVYGRTGT